MIYIFTQGLHVCVCILPSDRMVHTSSCSCLFPGSKERKVNLEVLALAVCSVTVTAFHQPWQGIVGH